MSFINLTKNKKIRVDKNDLPILLQHSWCYCIKTKGQDGYAQTRINNKCVWMHRFITNCPKGLTVDHINGDRLDNRRCNLRICTQQQNLINNIGRKKRKSKFIGVYKHSQYNKFVAQLSINGKVKHVGVFNTEIEAAKARDNYSLFFNKEFAKLNFKSK